MSEGIDIARQRIAKEAKARTGSLDLSGLDLSYLPGELAELSHLDNLNCFSTQISDLSPLVNLKSLRTLRCYDSRVNDLRPLADLRSLLTLDCPVTLVSDLGPLADLIDLQILICGSTTIGDLTPLADLKSLQVLKCPFTKISDLTPLTGLRGLKIFDCSHTQVSDLSPLSSLTSLSSLNCSDTQVGDLSPLSSLTSLSNLNCSHTQVSDLSPLSSLTSLSNLDCSGTQVSDLLPLSSLTSLSSLGCFGTQVSDLTPLRGLSSLSSLNCSLTYVDDLTPLCGLSSLSSLDCSHTPVSDLVPLSGLTSLSRLNCYGCVIDAWSTDFWRLAELEDVRATEIAGVPSDLFPKGSRDNCLPALRAHLDDLGDEPERLTDVKLIVLGNGRIGKTQIVNRLCGEPFEADADSTHGVSLVQAPIPGGFEEKFNIWDFGGQDIYFGTHMLFLRSRAVFMLVWMPESGDAESHKHSGLTFRNQPVVWWLDCIRRFGNAGSPLVVVQNQLDRDGDRGDHPALADCRDEWKFCRSVAYSAATDEGRGGLDDHLKHAAKRFNPPLIGKGRLEVMRRLQAWREEDRQRAPEDKRYRTLTFDAFKALCKKAGRISDPVQFLHFLHNAGLVFWREELFQSRVILDQAWVLDAVYAVFHREKCLKIIRGRGGQFTRTELGMMIWDAEGYSEKDQDLFLSFMLSCDICFVLRRGSEDAETVYVAPDHLPEDWEPEARQERWGEDAPDAELTFDYESLPPILMRNLIARIGGRAGLSCDYWRKGFYGYESRTGARVLVEQNMMDRLKGSIRIQARGGRAVELVGEMEKALIEEERRLGLRSERIGTERLAKRPVREEEAEESASAKLDFAPEPRTTRPYYVSYAWEDDRTEAGKVRAKIVDGFCARAKERGVTVQRDKDVMRLGDRISTFMKRLARGDRVVVVLSDKYLRSPFCMYELYEIWLQARGEDERFLKRVRLFTQEDAKIWNPLDRADYAIYWDEEYERHQKVIKERGLHVFGEKDTMAISLMQKFSSHIGDILTCATDVLQPRNLDELESYSFDGDFDD